MDKVDEVQSEKKLESPDVVVETPKPIEPPTEVPKRKRTRKAKRELVVFMEGKNRATISENGCVEKVHCVFKRGTQGMTISRMSGNSISLEDWLAHKAEL